MRRAALAALLACVPAAFAQAPKPEEVRRAIESHLGRPYVWGASGFKAFDCSGFVWRVALENGLFFKRTTARKMWFSTNAAKAEELGAFGNLVFFNDLKHVGIVNDKASFYHAQSSKGTNLSTMNSYWRPLAMGERRFFVPADR